MKKIAAALLVAFLCVSLLSSCASGKKDAEKNTASIEATIAVPTGSDDASFADVTKTPSGDFSLVSQDKDAKIERENDIYIIKTEGEYTASGALDGQIKVDAGDDDEVTLILDNAKITCSYGSPILASSASEFKIVCQKDSYNVISDERKGDPGETEDSDYNFDAAVYSACDLSLSGKGTLIVESVYDNGVKTKDDLKIRQLSLKVTCPGNALKGNDSIEIKSGELFLVSTESDGIKTSNSDISSKGKQRGNVVVSGGKTEIYSARDGISASYNAEISGECVLNIYTSSYSDKSGEVEQKKDYYLIVPQGTYSEKNGYYAYFYGESDETGIWEKCEYATSVSDGRARYAGLKFSVPSGYPNVLFNVVPSGEKPDGNNYTASSGGETLNTLLNGYLIKNISSGVILGDWVSLGESSSGSVKTAYSSKGIKAQNDVNIRSGTLTVFSMDDAVHANSGEKLENGSLSTGNVTVDGGNVNITCADDGIHADGTLNVNGGNINVAESHEGLEANVININGGNVVVFGKDDGINAFKGDKATLINITGGYLDVTTPSGDTDAVDSNGDFRMSGGFAIIRGGAAMGGMAGSVDTDGSVTVTGGTIVALGGICATPSGGSVNTFISQGTRFPRGSYVLTDGSGKEIASFELKADYSSVWTSSDEFELGKSYKIVGDGNEAVSWTQDSSVVGSAGGGFRPGQGGQGRPGGPGGRR